MYACIHVSLFWYFFFIYLLILYINIRCTGNYNFANTDRFEGEWKYGTMHGKGTYFMFLKDCNMFDVINGVWHDGSLNVINSSKKMSVLEGKAAMNNSCGKKKRSRSMSGRTVNDISNVSNVSNKDKNKKIGKVNNKSNNNNIDDIDEINDIDNNNSDHDDDDDDHKCRRSLSISNCNRKIGRPKGSLSNSKLSGNGNVSVNHNDNGSRNLPATKLPTTTNTVKKVYYIKKRDRVDATKSGDSNQDKHNNSKMNETIDDNINNNNNGNNITSKNKCNINDSYSNLKKGGNLVHDNFARNMYADIYQHEDEHEHEDEREGEDDHEDEEECIKI
jgi:hypothetical protein